jgi:predicted transcriptional regulator
MEILASLFDSPKGPTRLAQACNLNYTRIGSFVGPLVEKGLIRPGMTEGQEVFSITEEGYKVYRDWLEIWRRLPLKLT